MILAACVVVTGALSQSILVLLGPQLIPNTILSSNSFAVTSRSPSVGLRWCPGHNINNTNVMMLTGVWMVSVWTVPSRVQGGSQDGVSA